MLNKDSDRLKEETKEHARLNLTIRPRKPIDALNPENEKTVAFYAAVIMLGTVVVLAVAGLIMIILKALSIIDYLKGFF